MNKNKKLLIKGETNMIKMTNEEIVSAYQALHMIGEHQGCDPVAALKAARNKKILLPLVETRDEAVQKTLKQYAMKDENGDVKSDDAGNALFVDPADKKKYMDAFKKIGKADVEVEALLFTEEELQQLQATPNEMYALLPMLK